MADIKPKTLGEQEVPALVTQAQEAQARTEVAKAAFDAMLAHAPGNVVAIIGKVQIPQVTVRVARDSEKGSGTVLARATESGAPRVEVSIPHGDAGWISPTHAVVYGMAVGIVSLATFPGASDAKFAEAKRRDMLKTLAGGALSVKALSVKALMEAAAGVDTSALGAALRAGEAARDGRSLGAAVAPKGKRTGGVLAVLAEQDADGWVRKGSYQLRGAGVAEIPRRLMGHVAEVIVRFPDSKLSFTLTAGTLGYLPTDSAKRPRVEQSAREAAIAAALELDD